MDWSIKDCIEYCHDKGLIGEVNHCDLINELDDLYKDQEALTNIRLYGYMKTPDNDTIKYYVVYDEDLKPVYFAPEYDEAVDYMVNLKKLNPDKIYHICEEVEND